jgi:hypothetical protein
MCEGVLKMIEHGDSPGLALKKACRIGVGIFGLNELDRYLPSQLVILRTTHGRGLKL